MRPTRTLSKKLTRDWKREKAKDLRGFSLLHIS